MKSGIFIAFGLLAVVFAVPLPLRSYSGEPVLRIGHGVTAPRAVNQPDPEYSEEARRAGLQGKCIVSLVVNSEGKPENVTITRKLGMGLDENAVEAVRNWTFEPARKDGKPVAVRISVVVTFRMGDHAMPPKFRETLERARKEEAEFRRKALNRVYRIEVATAPPRCRSTDREENEPAPISISELKTNIDQYRLAAIAFINNKRITNSVALRSQFPIQDGEPFDWSKVSEGLRNLRKAYRTMGYVSFKYSVEPQIDNSKPIIALRIECDEGSQFFVDHINMTGLDEITFQRIRKSLYLKPGDLYNENLADLLLVKNSVLIAPDRSIRDRIKLDLDENVGTVAMTYDFTRCAN